MEFCEEPKKILHLSSGITIFFPFGYTEEDIQKFRFFPFGYTKEDIQKLNSPKKEK